MSGGAVSGNTFSSSGGDRGGGGVYVSGGSFTMSGGTVSGNTSYGGGGVYVSEGSFTMSGGMVSGNTSDAGGGVYVVNEGSFSMNGNAVVRDNILSGTNGYGREVLVGYSGIFKISGEARPERVFLYDNTRSVTISGPLGGGLISIDLGITSSVPLASYVNLPVLRLDSGAYSAGDLASLKEHFSLENTKMTESPWAETPITGYRIDGSGRFVAE
jgi:hypothetical protein